METSPTMKLSIGIKAHDKNQSFEIKCFSLYKENCINEFNELQLNGNGNGNGRKINLGK